MDNKIQQAITVFNQGGIVIFPTDTAFGIGCKVDEIKTIERLYKIRKRPLTQQMSLLVDGLDMAKKYVIDIPDDVSENLITPYWPGALTIVLEANKETVPSQVRANADTIGVRMPDHEDLLAVISGVGSAILGPSANFHGEKTPFAFDDLDPELIKQVDFVLKGTCKGQKASTVIDCTVSPWHVIREGGIVLTL